MPEFVEPGWLALLAVPVLLAVLYVRRAGRAHFRSATAATIFCVPSPTGTLSAEKLVPLTDGVTRTVLLTHNWPSQTFVVMLSVELPDTPSRSKLVKPSVEAAFQPRSLLQPFEYE